MVSTDIFYESVKIQQQFVKQLEEIKKEKALEFINLLAGFILDNTKHTKVIYGIAEGRSALALYDFLQQSAKYENIYPVTLDDPIRRYIDPSKENLVIAGHGLGRDQGRFTLSRGRVQAEHSSSAHHIERELTSIFNGCRL